jgi:hypothetical protein
MSPKDELATLIFKRYVYSIWCLIFLIDFMRHDLGVNYLSYKNKMRACFLAEALKVPADQLHEECLRDLNLLSKDAFFSVIDELELAFADEFNLEEN